MVLENSNITIENIISIALRPEEQKKYTKVQISQNLLNDIQKTRIFIENNWLKNNSPIYGFNTGVGCSKNRKIPISEINDFQEYYIKSHCVGVGAPFDIPTIRAAILLRANSLSKGYSGIRPIILEKLIEMLNHEIHPFVPEKGSLGASGDLAPLAHLVSVMIGEPKSQIIHNDQVQTLCDISNDVEKNYIRSFNINGHLFNTVKLEAKEAMALTNGTTFMLALGTLAIHKSKHLLKIADLISSLTLEATLAEKDAFHAEIHKIRNQAGQITTANNIRNLTDSSQRMTDKARKSFFHQLHGQLKTFNPRVQDRYSLRCIPQVHGASKDTYHYAKTIIEREINAVTDNPLVFHKNSHELNVMSGGNFHGQPLALSMDFLGIAMAEIGNISERRLFSLLNTELSYGLPQNLTNWNNLKQGVHTGLMISQYTAASLVSENKILSHPACIDSIPSSGNQEDHVSMGLISAKKMHQILENVEFILCMELLSSIQALHLSGDILNFKSTPLSPNIAEIFEYFQKQNFHKMTHDEYLYSKIYKVREILQKPEFTNFTKNLEV